MTRSLKSILVVQTLYVITLTFNEIYLNLYFYSLFGDFRYVILYTAFYFLFSILFSHLSYTMIKKNRSFKGNLRYSCVGGVLAFLYLSFVPVTGVMDLVFVGIGMGMFNGFFWSVVNLKVTNLEGGDEITDYFSYYYLIKQAWSFFGPFLIALSIWALGYDVSFLVVGLSLLLFLYHDTRMPKDSLPVPPSPSLPHQLRRLFPKHPTYFLAQGAKILFHQYTAILIIYFGITITTNEWGLAFINASYALILAVMIMLLPKRAHKGRRMVTGLFLILIPPLALLVNTSALTLFSVSVCFVIGFYLYSTYFQAEQFEYIRYLPFESQLVFMYGREWMLNGTRAITLLFLFSFWSNPWVVIAMGAIAVLSGFLSLHLLKKLSDQPLSDD
ncbi:hypothetical protein IMZ31_23425 (plasmid) [Pontibacillus sp. ALD_SL1]|uniref:hypothetical protein n=1 Tax=Pontibacillus sp. ALD_SL1 TaxID=2777185 RepID=UPI001A979D5F|nr:hypothetical protein [Pontibacillus sp. ALD_SL1]QST02404.1 hypothetical protein IMZ31_23425 [Pontibacillus sp. ALD_SL1]